ncbi:MAG: tRNA lysidine(34) synthetase TilS [Gammaproteobacteria bacterium]|nr:tRNA lysidine(34) synthetase TilS [Gammaproteobacteria bacterium]
MKDLIRHLRVELAGVDHQRLAVAFSGGLDSTVLLHAAAGAALPAPVVAVHVNHGLHPSADQWQAHCAAVCRTYGIELLCQRVEVAAGNVEAQARRARYQAFDALLDAGDLLLLAHHQDDQAETVLMRLAQGRGAAAMPRTRRLPGGAALLRPFLGIPKRTLQAAAEELDLDWLEDPGNADATYDRNFLRHEGLPHLAERWPGLNAALARAGKAQADTEALLRHLLNREALPLNDLPPDLRPLALRAWLARFDEQGASERALAEFAAQFEAPTDAQPELRLRRGCLRRWRGAAHYVAPAPALAPCYELQPPGALRLPHGELVVERAGSGGFCAAGVLTVRFRRGGERLRSAQGSRSLKQAMQDAGLPPWLRSSYPLLYSGDALVAVPGIAVAACNERRAEPRWRAIWNKGGKLG